MKRLFLKALKLAALLGLGLILLHLLHLDGPLGFLLFLVVAVGAMSLTDDEEPRRLKPTDSTALWAEKIQID